MHLNHEESIMRLRVGSGLPNIQKDDIQSFKIKPQILEEQEKILTIHEKTSQKFTTSYFKMFYIS